MSPVLLLSVLVVVLPPIASSARELAPWIQPIVDTRTLGAIGTTVPEPETVVVAETAPEAPVSMSIGAASRGRLVNGVRLESSDRLVVKTDENAYGTAETVDAIKTAVLDVERRYPGTPALVVGALSREHGGRLRPHRSHQSGRDADLGYYLKGEDAAALRKFVEVNGKNLDIPRTWALIESFMAADKAEYIFIDRSLQKILHHYVSTELKASPKYLERVFEYPKRHSKSTIIRHRRGHRNHLHVRFRSPLAVAAGNQRGAEALAAMGKSLPATPETRTQNVVVKVRKGDTLAKIAKRNKVELKALMKMNRLTARSVLQLGQKVTIRRKVTVLAQPKGARPVCNASPRAIGCFFPSRS